MARATHLTIGTADRIRLDAGSNENDSDQDHDEDGQDGIRQEVQVSVTYVLDAGDDDLAAVAAEKAGEVQRAHEAAWNRIGVLGNGTPCGCRSGYGEEDDEGSDGSPQHVGPPDLPPAVPSAGTRLLPSGSRPAGYTDTRGPDAQADAEPVTGPQKILIRSRAKKIGLSTRDLDTLVYQQFKVWRLERLTKAQAASLLDALDRDLKERDTKERDKENGTHGSLSIIGTGRAT